MNRKFLPILAGVPLLVLSCGKKSANPAAAEASATPAETGVILAKRGYLPPAGTKAGLETSMTMDGATLHVIAGSQQMEGTASQSVKGRETLEFLPGGKLRRTVVSKKSTGKMVINGMEQPTPDSPDPLEGQAVILEKKDGKWVGSLEKGSPTPEQEPALAKMAKPLNDEPDVEVYGEAPHKIGDKWNVDPVKLGSFGEAEGLSGSYAVEFLRIEDYQGTPCAVLKALIDIKGKTTGEKGKAMDMRMRGELTTRRSLKDMTDLDVLTSGTVNIDGAPAPGVTLQIEGPMKVTQKVTVTAP